MGGPRERLRIIRFESKPQELIKGNSNASFYFQPRTGLHGAAPLTLNSKPQELIQEVNNLKKRLKKILKSDAPIAKADINFFRNILKRKDELL